MRSEKDVILDPVLLHLHAEDAARVNAKCDSVAGRESRDVKEVVSVL